MQFFNSIYATIHKVNKNSKKKMVHKVLSRHFFNDRINLTINNRFHLTFAIQACEFCNEFE